MINPGLSFILMTVLTLTTGTAFIMWLGEQISERGIGNGMSLIIFTGIVVGLPHAMAEIYTNVFVTRQWNALQIADHPAGHGGAWWPSSCWSSAANAASRCSTPSAWWDAG